MRAAEQGPKQGSIQDWNIHWNLRLLGETQRAQKQGHGPKRNVILLPRLDLEKKSGALRWLIRQNLRLSRKCVRWKVIFFGPEGMIGKGALGKWRAFSGATSWRVLRRRVRLGWSIQRLLGSRVVTQPARFQGSTRFCEAAHGYWSRIWTMNL